MLTDTMITLLKRQIEHEIHNSVLYQKIAMWLNVKGFTNISKYYKDWSNEEKKHSMWVQEFLEALNIFVQVDNIEVEVLDFDITNFTVLTLETEKKTTSMLEECLRESYNIGNTSLSTVFLLDTMIKEQIEETDKANTLNDTITNIGNNLGLLQLFDSNFSS